MREKKEKKEKIYITAQSNLVIAHTPHRKKEDDASLLTLWWKHNFGHFMVPHTSLK
jgi:hypothetical protein